MGSARKNRPKPKPKPTPTRVLSLSIEAEFDIEDPPGELSAWRLKDTVEVLNDVLLSLREVGLAEARNLEFKQK